MADIPIGLTKELIALRVAKELKPGAVVNLGIGLPTLVANFVPEAVGVMLQAENGILGYGGITEDNFDPDLINASGQPVTLQPGSSFFDSVSSFAMIRGGHVDVAILGAMEISQAGDIANWMIPGKMVKGMGGAMDLVAGVKKVIVMMEHVTRKGLAKLIPQCTLPLTGRRCVDMLITDLAVLEMDRRSNRFRLIELAPGVTVEDVKGNTTAEITVVDALETMAV